MNDATLTAFREIAAAMGINPFPEQDLDDRCSRCSDRAEWNGLCETCADRVVEDMAAEELERREAEAIRAHVAEFESQADPS